MADKIPHKQHKQLLTLDKEHGRALAYLARETGDPNKSGFIRRHIESEMRERLGPNWRDRLDEIESGSLAVAS